MILLLLFLVLHYPTYLSYKNPDRQWGDTVGVGIWMTIIFLVQSLNYTFVMMLYNSTEPVMFHIWLLAVLSIVMWFAVGYGLGIRDATRVRKY